VTVEEVGVLTAQVQLSACEGDSTSYNGQLLPAGSSQEFTFTASSGCDSVVTVEVLPISNDTTFLTLSACPGETANYNGNELAAGSQQQFVFLNEQGCDSIVSVTVESATAINIELSDEHSCPNIASGIVNIELLPGSASPLSFALNGAPYSSDLTYTGLAAGAYTLIAQDTNGCQLSSNFNIESEPPLIIDIESQPITCDQAQGVLLANVRSGDDGSLTLTWSDSTTGNLLTSTQAGTFQLEATNACEAQTYEFTLLDVRPDEASLLYVPNAFSPNDDGVNDTFRAYTGRSSIWNQYHLMVFDRWGNMLFETNDPEVGWDGFFRGTLMNDAVHVWHIEGEIENCGRTFQITNKGDVTIVR
jgi:gliding motility-associated-like protein